MEGVEEAREAFSTLADIDLTEEKDHICVSFKGDAELDPENLPDEFLNHALYGVISGRKA